MHKLALPVAAVAALALTSVPAGPAYAGTCAATATPPVYKPGASVVVATGSMRCAAPATGMTVTVCIEELAAWVDGVRWSPTWCETTTAPGSTSTVTGGLTINVPIYSTIWRTAVRGGNDDGDSASAESVPVPWVNCACVII